MKRLRTSKSFQRFKSEIKKSNVKKIGDESYEEKIHPIV
jgi:hypothetical protein